MVTKSSKTEEKNTTVENTESGEHITRVIETRELSSKITFGVEQSIRLGEYESIKPSMYFAKEFATTDVTEELVSSLREQAVGSFTLYKTELISSEEKRISERKVAQAKTAEDDAAMILEDTIVSLEGYLKDKQPATFLAKVFKRLLNEHETLVGLNHKRAMDYNSMIATLKEEITTSSHTAPVTVAEKDIASSTTTSGSTPVLEKPIPKTETQVGKDSESKPTLESEISKLEGEIEIEESDYAISCESPTNTQQFRNALRKQGEKIGKMKSDLVNLKGQRQSQPVDTTPITAPVKPLVKREIPTVLPNNARGAGMAGMKVVKSVGDLPKDILDKANTNAEPVSFDAIGDQSLNAILGESTTNILGNLSEPTSMVNPLGNTLFGEKKAPIVIDEAHTHIPVETLPKEAQEEVSTLIRNSRNMTSIGASIIPEDDNVPY